MPSDAAARTRGTGREHHHSPLREPPRSRAGSGGGRPTWAGHRAVPVTLKVSTSAPATSMNREVSSQVPGLPSTGLTSTR